MADEKTRHAVDNFFTQWVRLENTLNRITYKNAPRSRGAFNINSLKRMNILSQDALNKIASLRKLRNVLIHDIEIPDVELIVKQAGEAQELLSKLNEMQNSVQ